jgi:hypothetical protein
MDLITPNEARALLGVSRRQFCRDIKAGLIKRYFPEHQKRAKYSLEEVKELTKIKKKGCSYKESTMMAQRAYFGLKRMERIVQQLIDAIGLNVQLPDLSEENVAQLHAKAKEDLTNPRALKPAEVLWWANTFRTLGSEYFEAVALFLRVDEPYRPYVELGAKLFKDMPLHAVRNNPDLLFIYGNLKTARQILERSAFFYAHGRFGKRTACTLFPDMEGSFHEQMLALSPD